MNNYQRLGIREVFWAAQLLCPSSLSTVGVLKIVVLFATLSILGGTLRVSPYIIQILTGKKLYGIRRPGTCTSMG
jgi:hypothetical protein